MFFILTQAPRGNGIAPVLNVWSPQSNNSIDAVSLPRIHLPTNNHCCCTPSFMQHRFIQIPFHELPLHTGVIYVAMPDLSDADSRI